MVCPLLTRKWARALSHFIWSIQMASDKCLVVKWDPPSLLAHQLVDDHLRNTESFTLFSLFSS